MYEQIFHLIGLNFKIISRIILFFLIVGTIIFSRIKLEYIKKILLQVCSIAYAFLLYLLTLGIRVKGSQSKLVLKIRWIKFDFLRLRFSGLIWGDFANFLLFMPYGILFYMLKKRRFIFCMISAICVSSGIEVLQLIFQSGYCDVNDCLWNVFGALCGYSLAVVINEVNKKI